ncbi:MAG TPA: right-handed parallel beta-helix repeat-containing protein [Verrucomicrobiae bacterium]|nr:right-handed parallel beta-helix repeat-containing protein [Verrucomicrobiae bacterium]
MKHSLHACMWCLCLLVVVAHSAEAAPYDEVLAGNDDYLAGNYAGAEAHYAAAIVSSNWPMAYNNRGLARIHLASFAGADADFDTAKSLDAAYLSPYVNKGKSLAAQKRFADAVAELQAGIALSTNNAALLYNLGWVYDEQGQYALAITNYTAALNLDANYYRAQMARGIAYAKLGATTNAIADFYATIDSVGASNDFLAAVAAYNLQLLRGPGVSFASGQAATNYINGVFEYSTEQYSAALSDLAFARSNETDVADIPWLSYWCYLRTGQTNAAVSALSQANSLLNPLLVSSLSVPSTIYIDGVKRGSTPTVLRLFSSQFDISLRGSDGTQMVEWVGVTYTDGTPGGTNSMRLNPVAVTNYTTFGPVVDTDRDWLADSWEVKWFGGLGYGPQDDPNHVGLINLYKYWFSCNPTVVDTDGDGVSDYDEVCIYGTDPARSNNFYYVNDSSTNNDVWCTAPGDDANTGTDPAHPKASVQAVLNTYTLQPGDTVLIDTGTYNLTNNITVGSTVGGSSEALVVFQASPYGVMINRGNTESGNYVWEIDADYVKLTTATSTKYPALSQSWMKLTGGSLGVYLVANNCLLSRIDASNNASVGIEVGNWLGGNYAGSVVENCLAHDGTYGIYLGYTTHDLVVRNCTLQGSTAALYVYYSSNDTIQNNIFLTQGSGHYGIGWEGSFNETSDYNLFHVTDGAAMGKDHGGNLYLTLGAWRKLTGTDSHSLVGDPLFVNAAGGDYHLQSTAGSYHGGAWTADSTNSCGIDTAYGDTGSEPSPNATPLHAVNEGARNMGAYGGTEQASKTPPGRLLWLYEPVGGENFLDTNTPVMVRWTWVGTGWQAGDTLQLASSSDGGGSFSAIPGAGAVGVSDGTYSWNIGGYTSGSLYRLKLTSNQSPTVFDQSLANYRVGAGIIYYVNDGSTTNDEWCTAPGNDANTGTTPADPKATMQSVLDTYDLEPGDTVRIDTGTYNLTNDITVSGAHSGLTNAPVSFVASPYGVTINRGDTGSSSYGWDISASYVNLTTATSTKYPTLPQSWMKVTGGGDGVHASGSDVLLSRIDACSNRYNAIYVSGARSTVRNCLARESTDSESGAGIYIYWTTYATVENCTVIGNGVYGVWMYPYYGALNNVIRNCTIIADGTGDYAVYVNGSGQPDSDYNLLIATNGAAVGYSAGARATLAAWRTATGQDSHSFSLDPLFVDAGSDDYHLQSTAGSYHGGAWTPDSATSCGIDTGYGDAGSEPAPNSTPFHAANEGQRNMGAYGGTEQASKTPAGRLLWLYAPVGGEAWWSTNTIAWQAVGLSWGSNDTVRLEYSGNGGGSWTIIPGASALSCQSGYFLWDTTLVPSGAKYLVRASCNQDGTVTVSNNTVFSLVKDAALSFDGGDQVVISTTGSLSGTFTLEMWAKPMNPTAILGLIGSRSPSDGSFDLKLQSGNQIHADIGDGSSWITTAADAAFTYTVGTWYHIGCVVTPTNYAILVNGQVVGGGSYSVSTPLLFDANHQLKIGYTGYWGEFMIGLIDEVRIWNYARTEDEIRSTMYRSLTGNEVGLVGYWNFNESAESQTVFDRTPNGSNGQLGSSMGVDSDDPTRVGQDIFTARGTPISWLRNYGLTNDTFDVEELKDVDGDGKAAWEEYLSGTDPTNSASVLRITAIEQIGANIRVSFTSVSEKYYCLERCDFIGGAWTTAVDNIPGNDGIQQVTDVGGANRPTSFYRVRLSQLSGPPPEDSDGDGIPDWWMQLYFGHPTGLELDHSRAEDDPDGDGMSNLHEYWAGTNPTNSASAFRITSVVQEGDDIRVTWNTGGGTTNVVEATSNLSGSYSNLSANILISGGGDATTNYLDSGGTTNAPVRFYRVRLVP